MAPRDEPPLTQNPFELVTVQACLLPQFTSHLVETLDRILGATRCIQGFTQTLLNRGAEIIEFPSGYLLETERSICCNISDKLTNEITKSGRLVWCRTCT